MHFVLVLFFVSLLLQTLSTAGAARTQVKFVDSQEVQNTGAEDNDCTCYREFKCSSCSFSTCPFGEHPVHRITPLVGSGTLHSSGTTVTAWRMHVPTGLEHTVWDDLYPARDRKTRVPNHGYVVKFIGPMEEPVKAAQLAHALGVRTPRIFNTNAQGCAALLTEDIMSLPAHISGVPDVFTEMFRSGQAFSIQEWGEELVPTFHGPPLGLGRTTTLPVLLNTTWYQAGVVAVLDWLVGKSTLFNDVSLNWQESAVDIEKVQRFNLGNLIIEEGTCTDISLDVDMPLCRWDLWEAVLFDLHALGKPHPVIPWVEKVVIPILSLAKAATKTDGAGNDPEYAFGTFNTGTNIGGYEPLISPSLVQLGMVDTLIRAVQISGDRSNSFLMDDMPGKQAVLREPRFVRNLDQLNSRLWEAIDRRFRELQSMSMYEPKSTQSGASTWLPRKQMAMKGVTNNTISQSGDSHDGLPNVPNEATVIKTGDNRPTVKKFGNSEDAHALRLNRCCEVKCQKRRDKTLFNWNAFEPCRDTTPQYVLVTLFQKEHGADRNLLEKLRDHNEYSCEDVFRRRTRDELQFAALKCVSVCGPGEVKLSGLVGADISLCAAD